MPVQPDSAHAAPSVDTGFGRDTAFSDAETDVASTGAVPHTTQYPSSMAPPHPGS
ncbi:hypothetical protein ACLMAL_28190 [Nocardia sp. CWNU-33]|uniref:hypothetical protein n=1 Tax=Nocardia sp. CWNU-33 TaxID=3392117 RepID=UPI00398E4386